MSYFSSSQMNHAIIYIEQEGQASGVTFPSQPVVVSLLDYDDISNARNNPPRGYPLVCVSVSSLKSFKHTSYL